MLQGFQTKMADGVTRDGLNFWFSRAVHYISVSGMEYVIPIGASTNGASVPRELWPLFPPFGEYWLAAALHDCAYRNTLQYTDGTKCGLSKDSCDLLFKEAMESLEVSELTVKTLYEGVKLGGWKAFKDDRS